MEKNDNSFSRRKFLGNAALGALGTIGMSQVLSSCSGNSKPKVELDLPPLLEKAPDGEPLKAGLVGAGGRGTDAVKNFLNAGNDLSIHAVADVFQDRVDEFREVIQKDKGIELDDANCFVGFDAYKQLLETDVDVVILATPPYFRPEHFRACVEARKHIFMEKPVAVDPVGARSIMASAKQAETAGLTEITGTQRRHQRDYISVLKKVNEGIIGDIVAANAYWNQPMLWHRDPKPEWTEMEAMIRDWVNWRWLSGDHIVEQHIHNIDIINWYLGKYPEHAVGFGSRHRRLTGDQYDNFSVDFVYEGEIHMDSMCRQIDGCADNVSEFIRGTNGYTNCRNIIWSTDGTEKYKYPYPPDEEGNETNALKIGGYDQEHIDLVTAIRTSQPRNEAEDTAKSTLTAIMGRISAYTGKEVTWDEMMSSDLQLGPKEIKMGPVDLEVVIPVPGSAPTKE